MSTINENNIISIDLSEIKAGTPGVKITDASTGKSYYLPALPETLVDVDEKLSGVWNGIKENTIQPGTPCVRIVKGDRAAIVPLLPFENAVIPPTPGFPEIIVPSLTSRTNKFWACGDNRRCELGLGYNSELKEYDRFKENTEPVWSYCYADGDRVFAITGDGEMYVLGSNGAGQLGLGDTTERVRLTPCKAITESEEIISWRKVVFAYNYPFALGLDSSGSVWYWGGFYANVPKSTKPVLVFSGDRIKDIAYDGSRCLSYNYEVYNITYKTHTGAYVTFEKAGISALKITANDYYLDKNHHIKKTGLPDGSISIKDNKEWLDIEYSKGSLFAIDTNYHLYAAGKNDCGQLGLGDTTDRTELTLVDSTHRWSSIATFGKTVVCIDEDGKAYTAGNNINLYGVNGGGEYYTSLTPVPEFEFYRINSSSSTSCVGISRSMQLLFMNVECVETTLGFWQEADGSMVYAIHPSISPLKFKRIIVGEYGTVALDELGRLYTWGYGCLAGLPEDDGLDYNYFKIPRRIGTMLAPVTESTYYINGCAWYDIGYGDSGTYAMIDERERFLYARGRKNNQYGIQLVDNQQRWKQVSCSHTSTVGALTEGGILYVWGDYYINQPDSNCPANDRRIVEGVTWKKIQATPYNGIIGINAADDKLYIVDKDLSTRKLYDNQWLYISVGIGCDKSYRVWKFSLSEDHIEMVDSGVVVLTALSSDGRTHFCSYGGSVTAWGKNDCGQLGLGDTTDRSQPTPLPFIMSVIPEGTILNHTVVVKGE